MNEETKNKEKKENDKTDNEGGFVSHLTELRKRLIHSLFFYLFFLLVVIFFQKSLWFFS